MELLLQPPKPIEDRFRPDAEIVLFHGDVSEFLAQIPDSVLTEEELIYILEVQIPDLLDRRPELQWRIYSAFLDLFARREEIAAIMEELRSLHSESLAPEPDVQQRCQELGIELAR